VIDEEIIRVLRAASERAEQVLSEHRDKLDVLATTLEKEEVLEEKQIEELIGPSAWASSGANHSSVASPAGRSAAAQ
jgi:cell division protease FtsH